MNRISIYLLFTLITLFTNTAIFAQSPDIKPQNIGDLSGVILTKDSVPLELIPVTIVELQKNTLTDDKGVFLFQDLSPRTYTLRFYISGSKPIDMIAEVKAGQTTSLAYSLAQENISLLQEIRILGRVNKYSNKESNYISRLPLKYLENPQVYNVVPSALIQEQMAIDLGSVSKNIPGAGIPMIANQGRVTFRSRGFDTEPNARNGVAGTAFSFLDNVNLERLEAIKGPSTTLFGTNISSSYGGLYNRVTKKPYNRKGGQLSYTGGSWNLNRFTLDYNTPVNQDKTALFRINAATDFQKSFQDNGFTNTLAIAPSFSYQVNDRLSVNVDVEFGQAKGTSVVRFNPNTKTPKDISIVDLKFPYKRTFFGDDVAYTTQMLNFFAQANYIISPNWRSQTVVSRVRSTINGDITALNGQAGDTTILLNAIVGNTNFIATDLQQNFIGDFSIAGHRNRVVLGLDYYNNSNSFDRVTVNSPAVNFINPSSYRFTQFRIDSLTSKGTARKEKNGDNTYAAYASDVFNITGRLLVMGSIRVDRYFSQGVTSNLTGLTTGTYAQTSFSHKEGLVYEVLKDKLSVFGNYMSGFFNQTGSDKEGNTFKPEHGTQYEYGVKMDVIHHRLVGTFSIYNINVKNKIRVDPDDANYNVQDGTQRSKGFELDFTANPFDGFNVIAGYAYNNSLMTKADSTIQGLRPSASGPSKTFNFWTSYAIPKGQLQGLGIGFGGNTGNKSYQTNTKTVKVWVPSYVMLDATVFYDRPKFRIGFKMDNLTSEKAWSVRLTPQPPARFLGSFALKF